MGDTVQFPTLQAKENELYDMTKDLDEMYQALNKAHGLITELELQANELEVSYEAKLRQYISKVGLQNIPIGLLQYSTDMEHWIYEQKDS